MKTLTLFSAGIFLLGGCSSIQQTTSRAYGDDVYASSKDKKVQTTSSDVAVPEQKSTQEQPVAASEPTNVKAPNSTAVEKDEKGNTYITNKYYDSDFKYDDYYDYEYAVRMRRFHNPISSYGYYDNYYTNTYWYSYQPAHWGLSVYLGYPWWGNSYYSYNYYPNYYYPGWGWNSYWGMGGYHHGYWHGYHHGYNNGYWNGYWNGYHNGIVDNYYYNSYDNSGAYYGPRGSSTHSNGNAINAHGTKFENAILMESGFIPVKSSPNVNNSFQNNTHPVTPANNSFQNNTHPVTPANNSFQNNTHPVTPANNSFQNNTHPVTPANNSFQNNTHPVTPANNSFQNNTHPVTPANNSFQNDPRPVKPNMHDTPKDYTTPKHYETPRNRETPKTQNTPRTSGGNNNSSSPKSAPREFKPRK